MNIVFEFRGEQIAMNLNAGRKTYFRGMLLAKDNEVTVGVQQGPDTYPFRILWTDSPILQAGIVLMPIVDSEGNVIPYTAPEEAEGLPDFIPTTDWTVPEIKAWMDTEGIAYTSSDTESQLFDKIYIHYGLVM